MLVVEGLTCRFGTKAAVDNASFSVTPGGFIGVIGRSGAGKSTLLRTINRLAPATSGRIVFDGGGVTALRGRELGRGRSRSRARGACAAPLAFPPRHDLPAVQSDRTARRPDQCADGQAFGDSLLAFA